MLSYSVARGITLFASPNFIPPECTTNGKFCNLFNKAKRYMNIITFAKNLFGTKINALKLRADKVCMFVNRAFQPELF